MRRSLRSPAASRAGGHGGSGSRRRSWPCRRGPREQRRRENDGREKLRDPNVGALRPDDGREKDGREDDEKRQGKRQATLCRSGRSVRAQGANADLLGFKDGALPVRETNLMRPKGISDELTTAALDAARRSYAPYSKAHSGVAIRTPSGRIYKGAYIENVAFNPSLSPLQTALAALIVAGETYSAISQLVLVEIEGSAISQKSVTEAALSAIAPEAKLQVVTTAMVI